MITDTGLIWLLGALVGSMLFFAVTVAPTVFRALPGDQAGRFLRAFFPQYYLWGLVLAVVCALAATMASAPPAIIVICGLVTVLFYYARQILLPSINRARDQELEGVEGASLRFKRLHLQSVVINALQLLLLLGATVYLGIK